VIEGRTLARGVATGEVVVLEEPLSFWGGVDAREGIVVSEHHPQFGILLRERVLVMPSGRGSSSSSSVLAEAIRLGTAPAAILLREVDPIIVLGALVAQELYGVELPVVALGEEDYRSLSPGDVVSVDATGDPATLHSGVG
jgi:predicted aconitase with swiveling domain